MPPQPGAYRLFVTVRDGKGGASEDNVPFQVARWTPFSTPHEGVPDAVLPR